MATLPSTTLLRLAGVATVVGLAALGGGIGSGCTLLVIAAYVVIFLAALVPAFVDWRDSKPRPAATSRSASTAVATGWRVPEGKAVDGRLIWIEPEQHRLH